MAVSYWGWLFKGVVYRVLWEKPVCIVMHLVRNFFVFSKCNPSYLCIWAWWSLARGEAPSACLVKAFCKQVSWSVREAIEAVCSKSHMAICRHTLVCGLLHFQSLFHTAKFFSLQRQIRIIWSSVSLVLSHSQKEILLHPTDLQVENVRAICRFRKTLVRQLHVSLQQRKAKGGFSTRAISELYL